jgi:hypothetical protein
VGAPDTGVALVMERIVGDVVRPDVVPYLLPIPVSERIDLKQSELGIPVELPRVGAGRGLVATDTRDPGIELAEFLSERLDFADAAALVGLAAPEGRTELPRLLLGRKPRLGALHLDVITTLDIVDQRIGFGKQEVSILGENTKVWTHLGGEVNQYDVLGAEARGNGDPGVESLQPKVQQLGSRPGLRLHLW